MTSPAPTPANPPATSPATPPVVTRFAPSPTGHLHIGGARTALFCWAFAKAHRGYFMIRIEDTDAARSSAESARGILEDLKWLGLEADAGPYVAPDGSIAQRDWREAEARIGVPTGNAPVGTFFQAQRTAIYNRYIEQLVRAGRAYPAFESNEEIEAQRKAAVAAKQTYRYPRPDYARYDVPDAPERMTLWEEAKNGRRHVVRFAAPPTGITVPDQVLGDVKIAPGELDDFVIRKAGASESERLPTYHFAVVIDDETMGVTHVLRAQEHLANTPRHVALQQALVNDEQGDSGGRQGQRFRTPVYGHMPLIFNMDGTKMSKRDKAKAARAELQKRVKEARPDLAGAAAQTGRTPADLTAFLNKDNDALDIAEAIGRALGLKLPEIEVSDFREAGYLPEAITNFLGLLGWNPGMKTPDGKDLEKFDRDFLAHHFSLERIGRTNAKFDRAKLASFNGDYLAALPEDQYVARFRHWLEHDRAAGEHAGAAGTPPALQAVLADPVRRAALVAAVRPRAKTLADVRSACTFLTHRLDDSTTFDAVAVDKHLKASAGAGLALLREFRARLASLPDADLAPASVTALIDAFAKDKAFPNPGPIAQPLRVALTGSAVSPGLGETITILGKPSALARIDACLAACA